jgi:very-short-patch-repair endonuclease
MRGARGLAGANRECQSAAIELALWNAIKGKKLGVQFRAQVPLGNFIADFAAIKERLIVEVDGGHHASRRGADGRRDRKLRRLGYRVLRLDAELVLGDLEEAVRRIRAALTEPP